MKIDGQLKGAATVARLPRGGFSMAFCGALRRGHCAVFGDAFAANVNVVSAAVPQPLSPLHSARANPNRSNVQGGVFSTANATPSKVGKARVDSIAQQSSFTLAHN